MRPVKLSSVAAAIWTALAEKGHVNAQANLGFMYDHGTGVDRDHRLAAQWYRAGSDNRLLVAIAAEVAANHLKLEPLQVEGAELAPVLAYFTELDFQPVTGPRPVARGATLLGGRYCTIQGVTAAQLRYRAPDGTLSTWYEGTLPPRQLAALPDIGTGGKPARSASCGRPSVLTNRPCSSV